MWATSVVVLLPGGQRVGAVVVAEVDGRVGPFGGEGALVALDLAVLPGAVRLDGDVLGVEGFEDLGDFEREVGELQKTTPPKGR